jgi:hypothetical protein
MIRCKVSCWSVIDNKLADGSKYSETVTFGAVCDAENAEWCKATPILNLSQTIDNPGAWGKFVVGQQYYLAFTRV